MRIFLTNHLPLTGSATGLSTLQLALGLQRAGHQVRVLVVSSQPQPEQPFDVRSIRCSATDPAAEIPFEMPTLPGYPESQQRFTDLTEEQVADYRALLRQVLNEEVDTFDPEIVHCQHTWVMGALVLETGAPYVVSVQRSDLLGYQSEPRFRVWVEQAAGNAGRVLADSPTEADAVREWLEVDADRVAIVPPGLEVPPRAQWAASRAELAQASGLDLARPLVVAMVPLASEQGLETILAAAAEYERNHPQVVTVILGDGIRGSDYEFRAAAEKLQRVRFLGQPDDNAVWAWLAAADLVITPAERGPLDLVWLQALAVGTPVLAPNSSTFREYLRDVFSGQYDPAAPAQLAELVIKALAADWKANRGPLAAAHAQQHHNLDDRIDRLLTQYEAAISLRR